MDSSSFLSNLGNKRRFSICNAQWNASIWYDTKELMCIHYRVPNTKRDVSSLIGKYLVLPEQRYDMLSIRYSCPKFEKWFNRDSVFAQIYISKSFYGIPFHSAFNFMLSLLGFFAIKSIQCIKMYQTVTWHCNYFKSIHIYCLVKCKHT